MFLSSSLHTLYTLFLLLTALKWSLYLFFPFILQMWTHHRCSVFVFTAWLSFPEGGLSHLLSCDYLLSQNSLPDVNTQAHKHKSSLVWPPFSPLWCNCTWMRAFPGATDTDRYGQRWRRGFKGRRTDGLTEAGRSRGKKTSWSWML